MKDIVIIGGPNGAGKTTAAPAVVPKELRIREFVNADEIASELSPHKTQHAEVAAARLMIERMRGLIRSGQSFAFETTCSGRVHARWLQECKLSGWRLTLVYLWLPSPQAALDRVARRVLAGGHGIPSAVVVRRYRASIANMVRLYLPLADLAAIYDNSDEGLALIAEQRAGARFVIHDAARWAMLERASQ